MMIFASYPCLSKYSNIVCTADEIKSLIDILNPDKVASGPEGISTTMLKPLVVSNVPVLLHLGFFFTPYISPHPF